MKQRQSIPTLTRGVGRRQKVEGLINIHDFCVFENGRIRTRTVEQHMQQWKPTVAFRLTQIVDRFGYNTSDNDRGGATVELYDAYRDAD